MVFPFSVIGSLVAVKTPRALIADRGALTATLVNSINEKHRAGTTGIEGDAFTYVFFASLYARQSGQGFGAAHKLAVCRFALRLETVATHPAVIRFTAESVCIFYAKIHVGFPFSCYRL
jgi:hypothetical protein